MEANKKDSKIKVTSKAKRKVSYLGKVLDAQCTATRQCYKPLYIPYYVYIHSHKCAVHYSTIFIAILIHTIIMAH